MPVELLYGRSGDSPELCFGGRRRRGLAGPGLLDLDLGPFDSDRGHRSWPPSRLFHVKLCAGGGINLSGIHLLIGRAAEDLCRAISGRRAAAAGEEEDGGAAAGGRVRDRSDRAPDRGRPADPGGLKRDERGLRPLGLLLQTIALSLRPMECGEDPMRLSGGRPARPIRLRDIRRDPRRGRRRGLRSGLRSRLLLSA